MRKINKQTPPVDLDKYVRRENPQKFEEIHHSKYYPKLYKGAKGQVPVTTACYQHACLIYEDGGSINNQSVRERFELSKNDSSIASRIISDTVDAGLIKPADIETASKKYMTYIPFYG